MDKPNFIRISSRTWITRSYNDQNHNTLNDLKSAIRNIYFDSVEIKIVEDHQFHYVGEFKYMFESAMRNGLHSIPNNPKYFYLQITFLDDSNNADFIMKSTDSSQYFVQMISQIR
jgi:hypothetical protein